jgi:hypothetical protein
MRWLLPLKTGRKIYKTPANWHFLSNPPALARCPASVQLLLVGGGAKQSPHTDPYGQCRDKTNRFTPTIPLNAADIHSRPTGWQ